MRRAAVGHGRDGEHPGDEQRAEEPAAAPGKIPTTMNAGADERKITSKRPVIVDSGMSGMAVWNSLVVLCGSRHRPAVPGPTAGMRTHI